MEIEGKRRLEKEVKEWKSGDIWGKIRKSEGAGKSVIESGS